MGEIIDLQTLFFHSLYLLLPKGKKKEGKERGKRGKDKKSGLRKGTKKGERKGKGKGRERKTRSSLSCNEYFLR